MSSRIYSLVVTGLAGLIVWPYLVTMWVANFIAGKYAIKVSDRLPDCVIRVALTIVGVLLVVYLLFIYGR